jgi:hypothetical protein
MGLKEWTLGNGAWHGICKMAAEPHVSTGIRRKKGFDDKGNRQFRKGFRSKWLVYPERMKEVLIGGIPIGSNNRKLQVAFAGMYYP